MVGTAPVRAPTKKKKRKKGQGSKAKRDKRRVDDGYERAQVVYRQLAPLGLAPGARSFGRNGRGDHTAAGTTPEA